MDISAVVVLDETTLQATVNPPPGGGNGEGGASLSDATPQALGPAAAGTASTGSRSDHRHAMPTAAQVGADATGTAAAAVAAHAAAADPHPSYTTGAEAAAAAPVQSVSLSAPSGWSTSTTNTGGNVTLTLDLPTGFSLPSNTSQGNWNTAYAERTRWDGGSTGLNPATGRTSLGLGSAATTAASAYATAAQGAKADTAVQPATLTSGLAAKADLVDSVVPTSQIPAIALVQYLGSVANQSAMLALRGQGGDWCIRTDGQASEWVIVANDGASLADWVQLPTSAAGVSSINGQTGVVTLGTGDLAESGGNLFFTAVRAIGAALAGFTAGAGTVAATDSILQALQKVVGNIAERALAGVITGSGLTIGTGKIAGRFTAGTGAIEELTPTGGLSIQSGNLVMTEGIVLTISNKGETAAPANNYEEKAVDRACTVVAVTFELNPTTVSTSGSSQVMLFARRSGTRTNLLSANASLPVTTGIFTNVSGTLTGTLTLAAGDSIGADLIQVGTGATGLKLTVFVRYS